ncbi:MAG: YegP family protein [Paracoccaceae bacterium]
MAERPYPSFLIYKDSAGEYRWRLQASNAKTIADSGEGYKNKSDCMHGIQLVMDTTSNTPIWKTSDVE